MQDINFGDRRIFERIPAKLTARCIDLYSKNTSLAQTCDISAQGVGLVTDKEFLPHSPLEVWLQSPNNGESLLFGGEVVWTKLIEPNKYRVGINFKKVELMRVSQILRSIVTRARYY